MDERARATATPMTLITPLAVLAVAPLVERLAAALDVPLGPARPLFGPSIVVLVDWVVDAR